MATVSTQAILTQPLPESDIQHVQIVPPSSGNQSATMNTSAANKTVNMVNKTTISFPVSSVTNTPDEATPASYHFHDKEESFSKEEEKE